MVNQFKKIVLLLGLERISDYNFRVVKSLLTHDLQLTKKMRDDYDRIKIADLLEEKFQRDAGLSKLIEVCQDIPELEDRVDMLRKEMEKVKNKNKRKAKTAAKRRRQDESSTSQLTSDTKEGSELEPTVKMPSSEKSEDTINTSPDIVTTPLLQEENNLPELSATNTCPAESEPQAPQGIPTTVSSSLQIPRQPQKTPSSILTTSRDPSEPCSTSDWASQVSPMTAFSSNPTIHNSLATSTLSYSRQASLESPKTMPSSVLAFQGTPATLSSNVPALQMTTATVTKSIQDTWRPQATVPSSDPAIQMTPATMTSGHNSPHVSAAKVFSSYNTPKVLPVTVPSRFQAFQVTSAKMPSGHNSTQVSAATGSSGYSNPQATPATMPTSINCPPTSPTTQPSNLRAPQVPSATVPSISTATSPSPETPHKKQRWKTLPKQPSEEDGLQHGSKQVMVLKATEPFTYDMREDKRMFHATVATETEFFRVKVFDIALKEMFIPRKVIVISDYIGYNGFLEIYGASCVSEVNGIMNIPLSLRQRATATPKINTICTQRVGTFVNGVFAVYSRTARNEFIHYGIEDRTGKMEVVVYGQFTSIYCEPGDKLRLFCFELSSSMNMWQLRSVRHSYMQVIQSRKRDTEPPNPDSVIETALPSYSLTHEQHWQ
ncbi:inteferon-activable protein 208-like isoform X1 [Psammomys obesus]|uniref:inteferon-activable protein 208-like isoform X1 n=1 Tax=Psammomys obesus TaxID=48139 RepID=UPI002452CE26|nr:inteferon-activable protein 208-like isoform X1 [Psammomys obesus]